MYAPEDDINGRSDILPKKDSWDELTLFKGSKRRRALQLATCNELLQLQRIQKQLYSVLLKGTGLVAVHTELNVRLSCIRTQLRSGGYMMMYPMWVDNNPVVTTLCNQWISCSFANKGRVRSASVPAYICGVLTDKTLGSSRVCSASQSSRRVVSPCVTEVLVMKKQCFTIVIDMI